MEALRWVTGSWQAARLAGYIVHEYYIDTYVIVYLWVLYLLAANVMDHLSVHA